MASLDFFQENLLKNQNYAGFLVLLYLTIQDILSKSGFHTIEINGYEENTEWFLGLSPKEATEMYLRTSPAMATNIKNLSISILNKIKSDMKKEYSKFYIKNNIVFPSAIWIVKAEK